MPSPRDSRRRIKSIRNTSQITKARQKPVELVQIDR